MYQLAAYLREREGVESLIKDEGFATYIITGEECYIRDIWVHRDFRKTNIASRMADEISEIAKKFGCTHLTGSVCPTAKASTDSLRVLLAYGFQLHSSAPNIIFFRKDF